MISLEECSTKTAEPTGTTFNKARMQECTMPSLLQLFSFHIRFKLQQARATNNQLVPVPTPPHPPLLWMGEKKNYT